MKIKFTEGPQILYKEISVESSLVPRIGESINSVGVHNKTDTFIVVDVIYELESNELVPTVICVPLYESAKRYEILQGFDYLPPQIDSKP